MDPSIMKLLEEDEDESMHSGADVEAFSAALNRSIEGGTSNTQPSQPEASFSQDNNQASNQMYSQWQPSHQDENIANQSQEHVLGNEERREDNSSSKVEVKEQSSSIEIKQEANSTQTPGGLHMQYNSIQADGKGHRVEHNSGQFGQSLPSTQMQMSGRAHPQISEQHSMHNPSSGPQLPPMQRVSGNQPVPVPVQAPAPDPERGGAAAQRQKQIPFGSLLPIILPELDKDRAMQLQTLYTKLRKNEIPKDGFVRHMRDIVGDQMLRLAVVKMQAKSQNPTQQQHPRPQTGTAPQFGDTYSFGHLPSKSQATHQEIRQLPASHGMQSNQMTIRPMVPIQGLSKEQKEHLHFPQGSFPMYGATSYQPYPGTNVNTPATMVKPQPRDSQMRQAHLQQGFAPDHSSAPWQAMSSMSYVKQEPTEQAPDKQTTAVIFQPHGPTFSSSVQVEQGKGPGTSNYEQSERQNMFGIEGSKTLAKKPIIGQKKPLDALASSPPLPSKKQKVSGTFADQSIEQLNDVTLVSGVNLREEEEQLFSIPKDDGRVSEASRKAVQEEEDRLILQKNPLKKKLAEIMTKCGLKNLSNDVERCLSLCVEERLRALISSLIRISKQRADSQKPKHGIVVPSDVREQILMINRKARDEWEKKQADADKLRKENEPESSDTVDGEKEKDEGRAKALKVNKEEDDKMRTTAANVAARAAVGGDDMLSKWQLMAQARQKRDGGPETASSSQVGRDANPKPSATSGGNVRDTRRIGRNDQSPALATPGLVRQVGRNQVSRLPPRVHPSISLKDVIAVLEREPHMAKSNIVYRLYGKLHADAPIS